MLESRHPSAGANRKQRVEEEPRFRRKQRIKASKLLFLDNHVFFLSSHL